MAREARRARGQHIGRPKALDKSKAALAQRMHGSGESASTIATRSYHAHRRNPAPQATSVTTQPQLRQEGVLGFERLPPLRPNPLRVASYGRVHPLAGTPTSVVRAAPATRKRPSATAGVSAGHGFYHSLVVRLGGTQLALARARTPRRLMASLSGKFASRHAIWRCGSRLRMSAR